MLKLLIILSACFSLSLAFWAPNDARLLDDGEAVPKAWVRDAGSEEEQEQEAQQLFTEEGMQEVNETLATFNSANCGIKNGPRDLGLIVGGTEAPANAWPWAVGLLRYGNFICGGTILNERYIITAAHCVSRGGVTSPASNFQVLVGAHTLGSSGQLFSVERVQAHESYNENLMQNDIALLRLRSSINFASFGKRARPVCLPPPSLDSGNRNLVGRMSTVVGWGTTREGGSISRTLQQVQIPIISNAECARKYNSATVREGQICAAYAAGGRDSCQGDSGGSLTLADGGKFYQLGVVSWGSGCARPGAPGVYTRVSKQLAWIARNTKQ